MKRSGEWVTLSPAASLCTEKAFRKFVWPSGDDISPDMRFLIHFHFKVSDFSASLLIGILLAQSPPEEVLDFSCISSLLM